MKQYFKNLKNDLVKFFGYLLCFIGVHDYKIVSINWFWIELKCKRCGRNSGVLLCIKKSL